MDIFEKKQRAVNFDLSTNKLRKIPELKNDIEAYKLLKHEFLKYDFTHRQYSGYVSNNCISIEEVYAFAKYLSLKYPWLKNCVKEFDVTQVEDIYSLKDIISDPYKNFEFLKEPPRFQENNDLYPFDKPTDFIKVAIEIAMINISETVEGIEVYIDYECVGIYKSYVEIEEHIKRVEPEIENAVQLVLKTKNKLKEER